MKRIGLLFALAIGLAGQAFAQPSGIVSVNGRWQTAEGEPLFFYNSPRIPNEAVDCTDICVQPQRWLPVIVDKDAVLAAPWGRQQVGGEALLTYRHRLMFTQAGEAASPPSMDRSFWRRAPDVESLQPVVAGDPSITRKPEIDPNRSTTPDYPPAALRARETGYVVLTLCMRPEGWVVWADISRGSGSPRLDDASLRYALEGLYLTPAIAGGTAVAVCGVEKVINWTIPG